MRTMRRRRDDAHAQRHPVDADVQKTAHNATECKKRQRPEMEWHRGPIMRVEYRVNAHKPPAPKFVASHRAARVCRSKFQTPPRLDTATCRGRLPSGTRP